jgi:hypothetical protein
MKSGSHLSFADNDKVMLQGRFSGLGSPKSWIAADIVRMENGLLAEHWDTLQGETSVGESQSGLPMLGDRFRPRTIGRASRSPGLQPPQHGARQRLGRLLGFGDRRPVSRSSAGPARAHSFGASSPTFEKRAAREVSISRAAVGAPGESCALSGNQISPIALAVPSQSRRTDNVLTMGRSTNYFGEGTQIASVFPARQFC